MLSIRNLVKNYHEQKAVADFSLEVPTGSIFGLLGPNGAGKSSLLRMVTGITLPDMGEVFFEGEAFDARKHMNFIGYMPEERGLYKKMKVREHLIYLGRLKNLSSSEVNSAIDHWFDRLDMHTWANKKVEDLSKGMSQKLQFVATVLHNPKLLILDEPFSGLDPVNTDIIKDEIFALAEEGTTIIFSTHRMEQVEEVCRDIALMNNGSSILEGDVSQIKQDFKENKYSIKFSNTVDRPPFEVAEKISDKSYVFKLIEGESINQVLKKCIDLNLEVDSFNEILPSLNEIFIRLVSETAIRQFQTS